MHSLVVGQLKVRLFMIGKCTSMYLRMQEHGRETNVSELTLNWKRPLSVIVFFFKLTLRIDLFVNL